MSDPSSFSSITVLKMLTAFPGGNETEFFSLWCWGSESFSFLGPGGEAYFSFLGGRVKFEK